MIPIVCLILAGKVISLVKVFHSNETHFLNTAVVCAAASLIKLFPDKYLLSSYQVPGRVLVSRNKVVIERIRAIVMEYGFDLNCDSSDYEVGRTPLKHH